MNKRKLLKAFEYDEKKVTAGIKKGLKDLRENGFSRDEIDTLLNMFEKENDKWPKRIYKIKTPSPKVAHIPEKPASKIGLVKAWKKEKDKWGPAIATDLFIIDFLREREAHIKKNYMSKKQHNRIFMAQGEAHYNHIEKYMIYKDVVERDYIKRPYLKTDMKWECPQCGRKYPSILIIDGICRNCYEASCNNGSA